MLLAAYSVVLPLRITAEDASLSHLALAGPNGTALAYNLSLTLSVRNPNWAMTMKNTEPFEAAYKFDGQQFDRVLLADKGFKHSPGKTILYRLATSSESDYVSLGNAGVAEYKKENQTGVFELQVALTRKVSYTARYTKCKIEATCPLKLRIEQPGATTVVFEKVKCKLAKAEKNC
jgi:hypothetical protein